MLGLWLRHFLRLLPSSWALFIVPLLARGDAWRASQLLRWHAGFGRDQPDAARGFGRRLRARCGEASPATAARLVALLSSTIHLHDSSQAALDLIEGYLGLAGSDDYPVADQSDDQYQERRRQFASRLRTRFERTPRDEIGVFLTAWLAVCGHVSTRGSLLGLTVMETALDLEPGGYSLPVLASQLGAFATPHVAMTSAILSITLATSLKGVGRMSESHEVYRWLLGIEPDKRYSAAELLRNVEHRLGELPDEMRRAIVLMTPTVLHESLERADNLEFVERLVGIQPEHYANAPQLRRCLGADLEQVLARLQAPGENAAPRSALQSFAPIADNTHVAIVSLLQALLHAREHERALTLLNAIVDLPLETRADAPVLADTLERFAEQLPEFARAAFRRLALQTIWANASLDVALEYADRIKDRTGFSPEDLTLFVASYVAMLLDHPERHRDALRVLEGYLWGGAIEEKIGEINPAGVHALCEMYGFWLTLVPSAIAFQRSSEIVHHLRRFLELRGFNREDRERFARDVGRLRKLLVQIGYGEARSADELIDQVLRWDVELSQRLLLERCRTQWRAGPRVRRPSAASDELLRDGWSLELPPPAKSQSYLPTRHEALTGPLGVLGTKSEVMRPTFGRSDTEPPRSWWRPLRHGVTATDLAAAAGPETIVLRAGFLASGTLFWIAFRSTGSELRVVARGTSDTEQAESWIEAAVDWHERTLEHLWAARGDGCPAIAKWSASVVESVDRLAEQWDASRRIARDRDDELARRFDQFVRDASHAPQLSVLNFWTRTAHWFDAEGIPRSAHFARLWRSFAAWLRCLADEDQPLERSLDHTTALFLTLVGAMWDLRPLVEHLTRDTDLVVEVDGCLHGVPTAFLPLGEVGGWLFEQVRSVRGGVSLLVPLLTRLDDLADPSHVRQPSERQGEETVVTISSFTTDDREDDALARGEWWLHWGQSQLAAREQLRWRTAARRPAGSTASLQAALDDATRLCLLTICGHGNATAAGVALGGQLWDGTETDLRNVDWLMLVSCSMGRLQTAQGADAGPDVEGFSAQLVAHGARSALVCRWPVHCLQAPWFANTVADAYLGSRAAAPRNPRALALAGARRRFLGAQTTDLGIVGLNTLAAFELLGEG